MGIFDDQKAVLLAQMEQINQRLATAQGTVQQIQAQKADLTQQFNDLKAAYFAWKGQQL